ncbi:unnamed protein product, partial [Oppiella nova]
MNNRFSVFDLTFMEWEQREVLLHDNKVYVCTQKKNTKKDTKKFSLIFKKDRLSIFVLYRDIERKHVEELFNCVKSMLNLLADGIISKKPTVISPILKEIVDSMKEHHNWTAAHIAAKVGLEQLFVKKSPYILANLNAQSKPDLFTPLHLAIETGRFGLTVQMMTLSDPKRKKTTKYSGSIVHFKKEDIDDLDKEDMQFGGTPLHWAKHRRAMERLIGFGFDLNVRNVLGETALHIMVKRMRLKCLIGLLCFGAKVNKPNKSGDSPLHIAVRAADVTSSQALIIFDTKFDDKNNNGETARHISSQLEHSDHHMVLYLLTAIGAKRCNPSTKGCKTGCAYNGNYEGKPYHRWPNNENEMLYTKVLLEPIIKEALKRKQTDSTQPSGSRLLCLDGGGVRGLITLQMLIDLEKQLKVPIVAFFDWVAGTSTGSILALLLCTGRSLTEIRAIYFRFKDKILSGPRPYSSKNFETLLEEEIGSELRMSDVMTKYHKHLIVNAILIDRNPAKLHIFRSYESPEEVLGLSQTMPGFKTYPNYKEQIAWRACRASGAAPTYFRASGPFLDGGLAANNPTLDAMTEFKHYNNALKAVGRTKEANELDLVVSFGTGKFAITPAEPVDVVRLWSFNARELYKNTLYVRQLGNLLINQVCATEGHIIDRAQSWCSGIKTPYFRVNPLLSEVIALDETSDVEICNALWETKAYMYAMREEVQNIITLMAPKEQINSRTQPSNKDKMNKGSKTGYTLNISQNDIQILSNTTPTKGGNKSDT